MKVVKLVIATSKKPIQIIVSTPKGFVIARKNIVRSKACFCVYTNFEHINVSAQYLDQINIKKIYLSNLNCQMQAISFNFKSLESNQFFRLIDRNYFMLIKKANLNFKAITNL